MDPITMIINEIISKHYEYLSDCEKNITQMEQYIFVLKAKTDELQAKTDMFREYFNNQMDERERLFRSASQVLEKAMEKGDVDLANIATRIL